MLNKIKRIIKRINEWWIRRNTIQLPDNYIHVEGNLSKGIRMDARAEGNLSKGLRMDAHAEGHATQRMGQEVIQNNEKHCNHNVLMEVNENDEL